MMTFQSLEKLESMLKSAEKAYKEINRGKEKEGYRRDVDGRRERFMKPGDSDRGRRGGFMKPSDDNDSGYNRQRYSETAGNDSRSRSWRRERSRSRERRSRSRERRRSRSRERRSRERERSRSGSREKRSRSKERISFRSRDSEKGFSDRLKNRFMRPGEGNSYASDSRERVRSAAPAWKKKEFHKPETPEREERDMKRSSKESKKRGYSESSSSTGTFIGKLIFLYEIHVHVCKD